MLFLALGVTLIGVSIPLSAQTSPAPSEAITADQLKTLLNETKFIKAEKAETQRMLNARNKELPEWFPPTLRGFIAGKVTSANPVKVDLPIYQKYLTKQQADQLILFFQGPAGDAVASHLVSQASPADLAPLVTARINQLDAQQQAPISETVAAYLVARPKIRNDQGLAFDAAYDSAKTDVISQHQTEYSAAASGNGSPSSSLAH
jgi:hypothetical protein